MEVDKDGLLVVEKCEDKNPRQIWNWPENTVKVSV